MECKKSEEGLKLSVALLEGKVRQNSGTVTIEQLYSERWMDLSREELNRAIACLRERHKVEIDSQGKVVWIWQPKIVKMLEEKGRIPRTDNGATAIFWDAEFEQPQSRGKEIKGEENLRFAAFIKRLKSLLEKSPAQGRVLEGSENVEQMKKAYGINNVWTLRVGGIEVRYSIAGDLQKKAILILESG